MTPRRKKLLIAALSVLGGCGVTIAALSPSAGPRLLSALPDGDVLVVVDDLDSLWGTLEDSERFARFRQGEAFAALVATQPGEEIVGAIEDTLASGEVTRWRASHVIGREAGASLSFTPRGRVRQWVAAFRIDTTARIAELAAGRLFMTGAISRTQAGDAVIAELRQGNATVFWTRLGDLLVAASARAALEASIASATGGGAYGGDWSARFALREDHGPEDGFRVSVRLDEPEVKLGAVIGASTRQRDEFDQWLRTYGLPGPVDAVSLSLKMRDGEIIEEDFIRGAVGIPGAGESAPELRPRGCHFWWQFRPGRQEAVGRVWHVMQYLKPPRGDPLRAGLATLRGSLQARLGPEVAVALAEQEGLDSPMGGFPSEFLFFRFVGAESLREPVERLLIERSLGIYEEDRREPVTYPYLVRHRASGAWVYEMVIRNTRRHDGYRPALAVKGSDLIYCSSMPALMKYLGGEGATRDPRGRAWVESQEGARVFWLDWRTPENLKPLRNAYDYITEQMRYGRPATAGVLADQIDYEELWRVLKDLVGEVALQQRLGVRADGGMRMRARWVLAD